MLPELLCLPLGGMVQLSLLSFLPMRKLGARVRLLSELETLLYGGVAR